MKNTYSKLAIGFEFSELSRVSEWLNAIGKDLGLPESLVWDLELCSHEAITNIMSYAVEDARRHAIQLDFTIDDGWVSLSILDRGQAFNPLEAPAPENHSLEDAKIGGIGIQLIRSLMDECSYERLNESNCLVLRKACRPKQFTIPPKPITHLFCCQR